MKFGVIIVTYNRRELLRECLECVLSQTLPFEEIYVVDNHSTDGTAEYLDGLEERLKGSELPLLHIFHLDENIGGAGGFSYGMERLSGGSCDWVLIIDDDAMISKTYMEELAQAIRETDYLAYSGTVVTEGAIDISHRRRIKNPCLMTYAPVEASAYSAGSFEYDISTFCGLLLRTSLIRDIGLPKTEYFIWFDDTEYCLRFRKQSRILNVNRAVLNHKTAAPGTGPVISWKHFYGFRNSIDIGKAYSSCPPLYMAYILANHSAHILIDSLLLLSDRRKKDSGPSNADRRYRIRIYCDVLKGMGKRPSGRDSRYLPGSGPNK